MSTEQQSDSESRGKHTSDAYQKLDRILSTLRKQHDKIKRRRNLLLTFAPLAIIFVGATLLFYIESHFYLASGIKLASWITLLTIAGISVRFLHLKFQVPDFTRFYRELTYQTDLPKLQHALDLQRFPRYRKSTFHDAAIESNIGSVDERELQFRFQQYLQARPEHAQFKYATGGLLMATAMLLLASTSLRDGIVRGLQFWHSFQKPNPYEFVVDPGDQTIEQGASITPQITFKGGQLPEGVSLGIKTTLESEYRLRPMQPEGKQSYISPPINLTSNARYYIKMGSYQSEEYKVNVQLRPRFSTFRAIINPPEYTGLDTTHKIYPFSRIEAYPGSKVTLSAVANKPLSQLQMIQSGEQRDTISPRSAQSIQFEQRFTVNRADTMRFAMKDSSGLTNENPFRFTVKPLVDERPFVRILQPDSSLQVSNPDSITIAYEGGDDFGLIRSNLQFEVHRAFVENPESDTLDIPRPVQNESKLFTWDLTNLQLKPRDKVIYWLSVTDNDAVSGYKTATSRKLSLTVPSMADYATELDRQEKEVQNSMEDVSQSFEQMTKEYQQFKEQMKRNPTGNYQQQKKLKEVQDKQKEFQKKAEELNKKFEKVKRELKKNNMLSEETQEAYEELQKLMKDIDQPELRDALKKLQEAVQQMDQNKLKKALENYEFEEETYREQLNRTIELFKKLKLNSDLEKMAKSLESLSKQEQELSKNSSPASEKIQKQKAIQEDTKQISSQMDSLAEQSPEDTKQQMKKLEQQARQQMKQMQKKLKQNLQEMKKNGNSSRSQSQQQQIQKQMKQMASQMRKSKSQMNQQRMQVNLAALKHIMYSMINLSESQEELTRETETIEGGSRAFVDKARKQKNIERQFTRLGDSLSAVAANIPMVSSVIIQKKNQLNKRLERSVDQLAERNKGNALTAERQVLGGINELSSMLAKLIDQLKQSARGSQGSGGGMTMQQMIKKLQQMSGKQMKLNQMMQKMINQMQGNRLSKSQIERMKQLARQQNQIRKQLQKMQEEGGLEPGDKLLSQMERLNEEMEETVRDLRGGQTDRKLLKRQKNILSQMLNAKDAINKRDKSDKRKARQPDDTYDPSSPQITLEELQKKIRERMQDPSMTKFADDYQQLIEAYFELLKKQ